MPEDGLASSSYTGSTVAASDYMLVKGFWNNLTAQKAHFQYAAQTPDVPYHGTVNNYLFCDGHAKALTPEKQGYDITQHPLDNRWLVADGRDGSPLPTTGCK